jgi:hypothetical protein
MALIWRAGYFCAAAMYGSVGDTSAAAEMVKNVRRVVMVVFSPGIILKL